MGRNNYFQFKEFCVQQSGTAMKVTTDSCLFGAWCAAALKNTNQRCILDIGTGTGLLSLMMAQQTAAKIDAIEIDAAAATQAQKNVNTSKFSETIKVHHADIRNWQGRYDTIVSNPPFYEQQLKSPEPLRATAHHSTQLTLAELLEIIADLLNNTGQFFLMLPYSRKSEFASICKQVNLHIHETIAVFPNSHKPAFRLFVRGGKHTHPLTATDLTIADRENNYTPAFTQLLQPFYLSL